MKSALGQEIKADLISSEAEAEDFLFSRKSKKIIEYCCIFPFVVIKYKSCMENTKN